MNLTTVASSETEILKGVQILVVDNDVDSGILYTLFLKYFGADVITSDSIKEALGILSQFIPHIIICEIRFLGESIYTLLKKLSDMEADNNNCISIIFTSTCSAGSINEIPEIEVEKYLLKPVDLDKLIVMINKLVYSNKSIAIAKLITQLRCA